MKPISNILYHKQAVLSMLNPPLLLLPFGVLKSDILSLLHIAYKAKWGIL